MSGKKLGTMLTVLTIVIVLQGCTPAPETNSSKNGETNQSVQFPNANTGNTATNTANNPVLNNTSLPNGNFSVAVNKKTVTKIPEPHIGSGGNDLFILSVVRGKLSSDKDLINSVIVEVKEGNVTLTGNVASEEQKKKAEELAKSAEGIKSVKNNLRVSQ